MAMPIPLLTTKLPVSLGTLLRCKCTCGRRLSRGIHTGIGSDWEQGQPYFSLLPPLFSLGWKLCAPTALRFLSWKNRETTILAFWLQGSCRAHLGVPRALSPQPPLDWRHRSTPSPPAPAQSWGHDHPHRQCSRSDLPSPPTPTDLSCKSGNLSCPIKQGTLAGAGREGSSQRVCTQPSWCTFGIDPRPPQEIRLWEAPPPPYLLLRRTCSHTRWPSSARPKRQPSRRR